MKIVSKIQHEVVSCILEKKVFQLDSFYLNNICPEHVYPSLVSRDSMGGSALLLVHVLRKEVINSSEV